MKGYNYRYHELLFNHRIDQRLFKKTRERMIGGFCDKGFDKSGKMKALQNLIDNAIAQSPNRRDALLGVVADLNERLSQVVERIDELKRRMQSRKWRDS